MKRFLLIAMLMLTMGVVYGASYTANADTNTATAFTGAGFVKGIVVANDSGAAITFTISDNATAKTKVVCNDNESVVVNFQQMDSNITILTSMKVVASTTSASASITILYQKK